MQNKDVLDRYEPTLSQPNNV